MKKTLLVLLLAFTAVTFAQYVKPLAEEGTVKSTKRVMTSEEFLKKEQPKIEKLANLYPGHLAKEMKKTKSWGFTVGSTHKWFAYNYTTTKYDLISATCRAVGTNSYIFVEDSLWGSKVAQAAVDSVSKAFNTSTPNIPTEGIYQVETERFGNVPDIDGDPKVIIFILDIRDGATASSGSYVAGFFSPINEYTNDDLKAANMAQTSNECEMYYCDANPSDLTTTTGIDNAMATASHEFQHMIHFYYNDLYNRTQLTFVNESMSQLAPYICGYPLDSPTAYLNESDISLFTWRSGSDLVLNDYARAQRFSMYIWDRCGADVIKNIIQSPQAGLAGIKYAFAKATPAIDLSSFLQNYFLANIVGDTTQNTAYAYKETGLAYAAPTPHYNPTLTNSKDTAWVMGVRYMDYSLGKNLKFNVAATATDKLKIKAIKYTSSSYVIEDVPLNTDYSVADYGTTYPTVQFAIMNVDTANYYPLVINSTGTAPAYVQLSHTTAEPSGVLVFVAGDSIGVSFDGMVGGQIDSIRVALRRAGSTIKAMNAKLGQIDDSYSWLGTSSTPFTKTLATFQLVSPLSATPASPYPVPWTNWCTIKFAPALDASKAFAVTTAITGGYSTDATSQNIMVNTDASSFNYSFVNVFRSDTAETPSWIYYSATGGGVYNFLMRAYVSFPTANGVRETVELSPKQFSVQQNYPNPFNPSTMISYSIPKDGNVKVTIFNTLGKEVAKLVDEFQKSGTHSVRFGNQNLASGVYFYRVEAGDNVKTLRMLLLK
jgi:hypothetical protein